MFIAFAIAVALHAPPTSDAASGMTALILARARAAAGGEAMERARSLHFEGQVTTLGLKGQVAEWDDLVDGRFLQTQSLGPVSGRQAFDGITPWEQDATGLAHPTGSESDLSKAITQAYITSHSYFFSGRLPGTIHYTGKKMLGATACYVLHAAPRGGAPVDLWFDADTYLLDREVITYSPSNYIVDDMSDYRTVDDVTLPFTERIQDAQGNEFDGSLSHVDLDVSLAGRFAMPTSEPIDFAIAGGKSATTFPIQVINNHIFLQARVDGKGPYRFVFDTGGQGILNPDVAAALGIHPAGAMQGGGAGAGTLQTGFAWVPEVQLGGATLTHQSFAILPLGQAMQPVEGLHIDGMVGYETAARYLTTIDYRHGTMTLSLPKAGVRPPGTAVPFVFYDTIPQPVGAVNGLPASFEIDTGSRSSLTLMSPYVAANELAKKYPSKVSGVIGFGIGGPTSGMVTRVRSLTIGSVAVPDVITDLSTDSMGALADPSVSGNIGGGVLKRFTVTFDYRNRIMYLQKNAIFDKPDSGDHSGLFLAEVPAGIRILSVLTSTPAAGAGLHARDIILSVNDAPASGLGLIRIRQILSGSVGTPVKLTVRTVSGVTQSATLTLEDYTQTQQMR
jgi:hypothetical protein